MLITGSSLSRSTDIVESHSNSSKGNLRLGWHAKHTIEEVARLMVKRCK